MRKIAAAIALLAGLIPALALAQAPPPVPALPDSARLTSYSLNAQTGPFSVGFALYGDSTDYGDWLEVRLCTSATSNPCSVLTSGTQWTLSSATGSLATIPRPITDATITLATAQTGTLYIVGARRPRRTAQFAENRGVAARDLNQAITDMVAMERENWDRVSRTIRGQPNESITPLQPASTRAGGVLCWDATGLIPLTCALGGGGGGSGNVSGPNSSTVGHVAVWGNATGTLIADGGSAGSGNVVGPNSSLANHAPTFSDTTGLLLKDSGLTITPSTGTLTVTNAKTLTIDNSIEVAGTDSTKLTFQGTDTYVGRATTDTLTNKTYDTGGTGNVFKFAGTAVSGVTGTGAGVLANAPTLITPALGVATATSINGLAITASTGTLTVPAGVVLTGPAASDIVLGAATTDQTLSGGANITPYPIGTLSSGSYTIDCGKGPGQYLTNTGPFTLVAPSLDGECIVQIENGSGAGIVTFSGFNVAQQGVALDTTNGHIFKVSIARIHSISSAIASQ